MSLEKKSQPEGFGVSEVAYKDVGSRKTTQNRLNTVLIAFGAVFEHREQEAGPHRGSISC